MKMKKKKKSNKLYLGNDEFWNVILYKNNKKEIMKQAI